MPLLPIPPPCPGNAAGAHRPETNPSFLRSCATTPSSRRINEVPSPCAELASTVRAGPSGPCESTVRLGHASFEVLQRTAQPLPRSSSSAHAQLSCPSRRIGALPASSSSRTHYPASPSLHAVPPPRGPGILRAARPHDLQLCHAPHSGSRVATHVCQELGAVPPRGI